MGLLKLGVNSIMGKTEKYASRFVLRFHMHNVVNVGYFDVDIY